MAGSAFLKSEKPNGDGGVCSNGTEFEVEKKLAASLKLSLDAGLVCDRKV